MDDLSQDDPFKIEILPNMNCNLALKDGVVRIYDKNNKPFGDYIYSDLHLFLDDYHLMVNLISNGPL